MSELLRGRETEPQRPDWLAGSPRPCALPPAWERPRGTPTASPTRGQRRQPCTVRSGRIKRYPGLRRFLTLYFSLKLYAGGQIVCSSFSKLRNRQALEPKPGVDACP